MTAIMNFANLIFPLKMLSKCQDVLFHIIYISSFMEIRQMLRPTDLKYSQERDIHSHFIIYLKIQLFSKLTNLHPN